VSLRPVGESLTPGRSGENPGYYRYFRVGWAVGGLKCIGQGYPMTCRLYARTLERHALEAAKVIVAPSDSDAIQEAKEWSD
jgi:hypothetical protein